MQALIIDSESQRLEKIQVALLNVGVQVTGTSSLHLADTCLRRSVVDVLIVEKHAVASCLFALLETGEARNPQLVSFLLSEDTSSDTARFQGICPSICQVLNPGIEPKRFASLVLERLMLDIGKTLPRRPDVQEPLDTPLFQSRRAAPAVPL